MSAPKGSSAVTGSDRLCHRDGVLASTAHGETVLLRLGDGSYYTVEEVGACVWELCDGLRTAEEVASGVCDEFDGPVETIRADVLVFLADLLDEGLLDRVG